jgi:hypothetical protein
MQPQNQELFLAPFLFILVGILKPFRFQLNHPVVLHCASVNLIVRYRITELLQVHSDLVSPACLWVALDHAMSAIEFYKLKLGLSVLCLGLMFKRNLVFRSTRHYCICVRIAIDAIVTRSNSVLACQLKVA